MFEDGDRVVGVELRISYWQLVGGGQMTDWCQHSHVGPGQPCSLSQHQSDNIQQHDART